LSYQNKYIKGEQTMTTHKIEVAHQPIVKQKFNWLLAIGIFILGLGLGAFATTLPIAKTEISEQNAAGSIVRDFPARPDLAEPEPGAIEAEAARGNSLVDGVKDGPSPLAWPPRPTQFHIAENAGVSLNENALAEYHQSERDFTPIVTSRIEENALDAYHQSEWGLTPSAVLPIEADALTAYHQSEWDRTLSPGLPIAKNETDAEQDLGLMDFSSGVNEAGRQRHDREFGLAAFSNLPESDAAQDIGLMEFFTIPDETSRQRTERAIEALPTIDPADRKFFNPGYGAQRTSATQSEAVLSLIENEMGKQSAIWFLLK
jgi:hypothetical protein